LGNGFVGVGFSVWFLSLSKPGDAMNERIKELAEQAGFDKHHVAYDTRIERFAELVRQDEREACAKIALKYEPTERQPYVTYAADEIKARGEK
jgi:hypothetical protein